MLGKIIKEIGLIGIGIISLTLAGCFHIPDKDRLPSKNKVETGDIKNGEEIEKAIDSLIDGINIISSKGNDIKNNKNNGITGNNDDIILSGSVSYTGNDILE